MATKKVDKKKSTKVKEKDKVETTKKTSKKASKKTSKEKNTKVNKSALASENYVVCENCNKKYDSSLDRCPYCSETNDDVEISNKKKIVDEEYDDEEVIETNHSETKKEIKINKDKSKGKEVKTKKKKYKDPSGSNEQFSDLFDLLKILVIVIIIVGVVYFITALVNGDFKDKKATKDDDDSEVIETIQNSEILASSIFNKKDKEYYVLMYDGSNSWADYYSMVYGFYNSQENDDLLPMFWVDLSHRFNKDILASGDDNTNCSAQSVEKLKVKSPTLIKIKKGENVAHYEGEDVVKKINEMLEDIKD